jgi:hypothetical protein
MLDQLGPADNLALVMEQIGEELIFLRGQLDRVASQRDLARPGVEPHVSGNQFGRRIAARPADQRAQAGDQLFGLERLGEIIVGTRIEPGHLVRPAVARGQHQHREIALFLAPAIQHGQAIDFGQAEVEDDRVIGLVRSQIMAVFAIGRKIDGIADAFERCLELATERGFVFDDQNAHDVPLPTGLNAGPGL